MFIDIHNHMLYGVDDGAKSIEESLALLADAKAQGARTVIFTPHYRHGMFKYPTEQIKANFNQIKVAAKDIGIDLFLGCEYHVNSNIIEAFRTGRCETLAESDYVLTEYSYETEYAYIVEYTQRLLSAGYYPVIAHVERYKCFAKKPSLCAEISAMGAMVQINADSALGLAGWQMERLCKKMLKNRWVDIIASDTHDSGERACHMGQCRKMIEKKYGADYAQQLFIKNPERIINNR